MKQRSTPLLLLFLLLSGSAFAYDSYDNARKINHVNLLLPALQDSIDGRTIQHTLIGYNGCYEWASTKPSILKVTGIKDEKNPNCESQAVVSVASPGASTSVMWITATDKETGDFLKCESKVAKISSIAILTKLRTIDVGDLEELRIIGYDAEGNTFSSLEGLRFTWSISAGNENLEMIMLKDTTMRSTEIRRKLELNNYHSDLMVFKGLKTGQATVNVRLQEKQYEGVEASVVIYVIEHFGLFPSDEAYLLPFSSLQFSLALIKENLTLENIKLPNDNYLWKSDNEVVGEVTQGGLLECFDKLGTTKVIVQDKRIANNTVDSLVHVIYPFSIDLQIKEYNDDVWIKQGLERFQKEEEIHFENNWNLIKGHIYYIRAYIYDERRNNIIIPDNAKIKFEFDNTYFEVIGKRNIELVVKARTLVDNKRITAQLEPVSSSRGTYRPDNLKVDKTYMIFSEVTLVKPGPYVHLPYYGFNVQQPFKLTALGGSNHYEWVSQNLDIAVVSQEGVILPKSVGTTTIKVHDQRNSLNADTIRVEITEVARFSFLEKLKELMANITGEVSYYFTNEKGIRYSNCSGLPVEAYVEHSSMLTGHQVQMPYADLVEFLEIKYQKNNYYTTLLHPHLPTDYLKVERYQTIMEDEKISSAYISALLKQYTNFGICGKIGFRGVYKGETSARGSLRDKNVTAPGEELRIRVYEQLKTHSPIIHAKGKVSDVLEVILAYGSSFQWEVEEGPYIWEEHRQLSVSLKNVEPIQNPVLIDFKNESPRQTLRSKKIFEIICNFPREPSVRKNIDHLLKLIAVNAADEKLLDPLELSLTVKVACEIPSSLQIYIWKVNEPKLNVNTVTSLVNEVFNLKAGEVHTFQVWVFNRNARPFYNFSSLQINWGLNRQDGAKLSDCIREETKGVLIGDQFKQIFLREFIGELLLNASSSKYEVSTSHTFDSIHDTVVIKILNDIELKPNHALLILDHRNSFKIQIERGSKEFAVRVNDSSIVDFEYDRNTQIITVRPLKLGYSRIEVEDLKLVKSNKAYCDIIVAHPERITLSTETNLLQEHDSTVMTVNIYDYYNKEFTPDQLRYLDLSLKVDSDSDHVRSYAFKITPKEDTANQFHVEGKIIGDHRLIASSTRFGVRETERYDSLNFRIFSNHVNVHVFAGLEARPKKIVMAPGCITSVLIVGGPSERSKMDYGVELKHEPKHTKPIETSPEGPNLFLVKGNAEGETEIVFTIRYKNAPYKVIAERTVPVKIAHINGLDILGMQDRKIHVGAQVRLIAAMRSNDDVFTPAVCPITFQWTTKNDYIFQIHNTGTSFNSSDSELTIFGNQRMKLSEYQIAVNATALNVGFAEIELKITVHHPRSETKIRSMKIEVINVLSHDHPTYIGQSSKHDALLLIPPSVEYLMQPNRDRSRLRFSLLCPRDTSGVTLTEEGKLLTPNEKGKVTVLVEDKKNPVSDLMMVNILITNVYSIFVEKSYEIVNLHLDTDGSLQIHLQDNVGRSFVNPSELSNLKLEVHVTNPQAIDVTLVEHSILKIRAKTIGVSLISVYLEDSPETFDVFPVRVGPPALGHDVSVHVGGLLDFNQAENTNIEGWLSEDSSILSIDSRSGKGVALKEGRTIVKTKGVVQQLIKVRVFKINRIESVSPISEMIYGEKKAYSFNFRFFSDDKEITELKARRKSATNNNLKFVCMATPDKWFTTHVNPDGICDVELKGHVTEDKFPPQANISVTVASDSEQVKYSYSQKFYVNVVWGFSLESGQKRKFELSRKEPSAIIKLRTPVKLYVTAEDEKCQDYFTSEFDPSNELQAITFTVPKEASQDYFETKLIVRHPGKYTRTESFDIIYDSQGTRVSSGSTLNLADYIVIIVLLIVAFFFITTVWAKNDNPRGPMGDYRSQSIATPRNYRMS